MPKTNAEKCREYRQKKKANKVKKIAKSSTERVREFRARQKSSNEQHTTDTRYFSHSLVGYLAEVSLLPSLDCKHSTKHSEMTIFHDEIEIEDFDYDEDEEIYYYPCPCGDRFQISKEELMAGEEVATCPSCSLVVKVIYDLEKFKAEAEELNKDEIEKEAVKA